MLITFTVFMHPFNSLIIDNRVPNIIIDHARHSSHVSLSRVSFLSRLVLFITSLKIYHLYFNSLPRILCVCYKKDTSRYTKYLSIFYKK